MERINKLFDEVRDIDRCWEEYKTYKSRISGLELEINDMDGELQGMDLRGLENEIRRVEDEYQKSFADIDRLALNMLECHKVSDMKMVVDKITDVDVIRSKALNFLGTLFYTTGLSRKDGEAVLGPGHGIGTPDTASSQFVIFGVRKETEDLFGTLEKYPEIQRECYEQLRSALHEDIQGVLPSEVGLYQDEASLYLVFQNTRVRDLMDGFHKKKITHLGLESLPKYRIVSHVVLKELRENVKTSVVERGLSDEQVEENNRFFDGTDFYIHSVSEWKLDVVMREMIEMTRRRKQMDVEEVADASERMPPHVSTDYRRFLRCFEVFRTSKSRRHEKGARVVERAVLKLFDNRRYDPSVYNSFVEFADITHFLRTHPEYIQAQELSRRKEELFFEIARESSRMKLELDEPLMMLKLYVKEKHLEFTENLRQFVPRMNREFFEIQFFELMNEGLMERIAGTRTLKGSVISDLVSLIDYILDLSFHIAPGVIKNQDKLRSYRMVLGSNRNEVLEHYDRGKLSMSREELVSLCQLVFRNPEDRSLVLDRIGR